MDLAEDGVAGLSERAWQQVENISAREPLYVAGESFGGPIALELARAHRDRVAGLILISTFARFPAVETWPRLAGLRLWQRLGDPLVEELLFRVRCLEWPFALGLRPPLRTLRAFLAQPRSHAPAYRQKGILALSYDAEPWLAELDIPVLVLVPRWDLAVPPAAGLALAAALPRATLLRTPGGHLSHLVHLELVGRTVSSWRAAAEGQRNVPSASFSPA
jgi:pimeloyl-ACP methyl ester carboxylesterase